MPRPAVHATTTRVYEDLPEVYRHADAQQTIPPAIIEVLERYNLATHPSAEASSGTLTVATNPLTNPSAEDAPSANIAATNYVRNPRAAVDLTNIVGYAGTETLTRVTGITGPLPGITEAVRVDTTLGTGVAFVPAAGGPTNVAYSGVLYARLVSGTATGWAPAFSGVIAGTAVTLTTAWQRITLNNVVLGGSGVNFGLRNNATNTGAVIEVTAAITVQSAYPPAYFDGATAADGTYRYAWTGTAHASTSTMTGDRLTRWEPNSGDLRAHRSTVHVYRGTYSARLEWLAAGTYGLGDWNGGVLNVPAAAGEAWTASAYVYNPATTAQTGRVLLRWRDAAVAQISMTESADITLAPQAWTRITGTGTAPAGTAYLHTQFNGHNRAAGDVLYIDAMQAEKASSASAYFDGATPAAGDYAYAWTGTAHASTSIRTAPAVTGWTADTGSAAHQTAGAGVAYGTRAVRAYLTEQADRVYHDPPVTTSPNTTYTAGVDVYSDVAQTVRLTLRSYNAALTAVGTDTVLDVTLAAGERRRVALTKTQPDTGERIRLITQSVDSLAGYVLDGLLIEQAATASAYFDGDQAGSEWTGTPHASTSHRLPVAPIDAGYPLLRYLGLVLDELGAVEDVVDRIDYIPADSPDHDPTQPDTGSELTDPARADPAWLPWLAQLIGILHNPLLSVADQRTAIATASGGWNVGTREAIATAARTALTGDRYVDVSPDPADPWRILVATTPEETPDVAAVLAAIERARVRPAGTVIAHSFYAASWDIVEALNPNADTALGTWDDVEALGSWSALEQAR